MRSSVFEWSNNERQPFRKVTRTNVGKATDIKTKESQASRNETNGRQAAENPTNERQEGSEKSIREAKNHFS